MERNLSISVFKEDIIAEIDSFCLVTIFTYMYIRLLHHIGCRWDADILISTFCCRVYCHFWQDIFVAVCFRNWGSSLGGPMSSKEGCGRVFKSTDILGNWHGDICKLKLELHVKSLVACATRSWEYWDTSSYSIDVGKEKRMNVVRERTHVSEAAAAKRIGWGYRRARWVGLSFWLPRILKLWQRRSVLVSS